jgi:SAM-dependent methyltransferase
MRSESLFSADGYYGFLLDSNVLLHQQAEARALAVLKRFLAAREPGEAIHVLDLACGAAPVSITRALQALHRQAFHYTGIDINPDQVERARSSFPFPGNVRQAELHEGNVWDLSTLDIAQPVHVVFSGMNLHHGTPEEIAYLATQLRALLHLGGMFISHDVYRPDATRYRRRPDVNPNNPTESFRQLDEATLQEAHLQPLRFALDTGPEEPTWREDYLSRMHAALLGRGGDPAGTDQTVQHMRERDYPISQAEFRHIFESAGFDVVAERFADTREPLGPYVGVCIATIQNESPL